MPKLTSAWEGAISKNGQMAPFRRLTQGAGPVGIALTAIDLWTRLPPAQQAAPDQGDAEARPEGRSGGGYDRGGASF